MIKPTTTATVEGGFHNVGPISLRLRNGKMSIGQYKRLQKHLCPVSDCVCGGRGVELSGITREAFNAAREDASYAAYYGQ